MTPPVDPTAPTCRTLTSAWIFELAWAGELDGLIARLSGAGPSRWTVTEGVPTGLATEAGFEHLSEGMRALLGEGRDDGTVRWLELRGDARGRILGHLRPLGDLGASVTVSDVLLALYGLGTAFCIIRVAWGPDLDVEGALRATFAARVADGDRRASGWTLGTAPPADLPEAARRARATANASLGALAPALDGEAVPLNAIVEWLVGPDLRLTRRDCVLHTSMVLDAEPEERAALTAAWHLRRGYDTNYVAPPVGSAGPDRVLRQRGNRIVTASRDGAAAIGWPYGAGRFEVDQWPTRFLGTWLLLHLQVLSERATLATLSAEVQRKVGAMAEARVPDDARRARDDLAGLVERMIHYSVAISTEDCGGVSDQVEFYAALREVHGINAQRAELRAEIAEIFGLVQARFQEAAEDTRRREEEARLARIQTAAEIDRLEARARELDRAATQRLQDVAGVIGLPLLVVSVISGVMGMNVAVPGTGVGLAFAAVMGVALALGLVVTLIARRYAQARPDEIVEAEQIHDDLGQLRRLRE